MQHVAAAEVMRRLALVPAAWLALSGAAAPQQASTIQRLAECQLDPRAALAAIGSLPVTSKREIPDGPRLRTIRHYTQPAGLKVLGFAPDAMASLETKEAGVTRFMMITTLNTPYAGIEASTFAANTISACQNDGEKDRSTCGIFIRETKEGRVTMLIANNEGKTDIVCNYQPAP